MTDLTTPKTFLSGMLLVALAGLLSACASGGASGPQVASLGAPPVSAATSSAERKEIPDPNEKSNREVFENNQKFYKSVGYPVAKAYTDTVPAPVRQRIDSFASNISEPLTFANNVLQLRPEAAGKTLARFAINSTIGLGGLFDVAAGQNLDRQSGDFGQTLYVWGARETHYMVLPIIGPTNFRDAIGNGVELAVQIPVGLLLPQKITSVFGSANSIGGPLSSLGRIEEMKALEESSIDFYAALRSIIDQKRQAELNEALNTSLLTANQRAAQSTAPGASTVRKTATATVRRSTGLITTSDDIQDVFTRASNQ